jgi:hypothetical protein
LESHACHFDLQGRVVILVNRDVLTQLINSRTTATTTALTTLPPQDLYFCIFLSNSVCAFNADTVCTSIAGSSCSRLNTAPTPVYVGTSLLSQPDTNSSVTVSYQLHTDDTCSPDPIEAFMPSGALSLEMCANLSASSFAVSKFCRHAQPECT